MAKPEKPPRKYNFDEAQQLKDEVRAVLAPCGDLLSLTIASRHYHWHYVARWREGSIAVEPPHCVSGFQVRHHEVPR